MQDNYKYNIFTKKKKKDKSMNMRRKEVVNK